MEIYTCPCQYISRGTIIAFYVTQLRYFFWYLQVIICICYRFGDIQKLQLNQLIPPPPRRATSRPGPADEDENQAEVTTADAPAILKSGLAA